MTSKKKADIVAFMHLVWILFGLANLPLLFIIPTWNKSVLIFAGITILSWIILRGCWFLQLENKLRKTYNPKSAFEEETFIQHYLKIYLNISCSALTVRILVYAYMIILIWLSLKQGF